MAIAVAMPLPGWLLPLTGWLLAVVITVLAVVVVVHGTLPLIIIFIITVLAIAIIIIVTIPCAGSIVVIFITVFATITTMSPSRSPLSSAVIIVTMPAAMRGRRATIFASMATTASGLCGGGRIICPIGVVILTVTVLNIGFIIVLILILLVARSVIVDIIIIILTVIVIILVAVVIIAASHGIHRSSWRLAVLHMTVDRPFQELRVLHLTACMPEKALLLATFKPQKLLRILGFYFLGLLGFLSHFG
mmetsp:Transcript_71271/g.123776  ORF Transcript_71271/g.123776 Transcript_71271/m.123776 type:complete len:248 (-) Transcript_71271:387-1130(-)